MIIAIDGPAGAGKGTLARKLATHYKLAYLDTGLIYRAVGLKALSKDLDLDDEPKIAAIAKTLHYEDLADLDLRGDEAANAASKIAVLKKVREALLDFQRNFAHTPPPGFKGAALDGRDIGTRVCPDADFKFYVTAQVEIRAKRRLKELHERGIKSIYSAVLQDMMERDLRDGQRKEAPLKPALDAYVIDTSALDPAGAFEKAKAFIEQRLGQVG